MVRLPSLKFCNPCQMYLALQPMWNVAQTVQTFHNLRQVFGKPCHSDFTHDDIIKWRHFQRYWSFVRRIHQWPGDSLQGQWHGTLDVFFDLPPNKCWANNREAGDLRRHHGHYDVIVMRWFFSSGYYQKFKEPSRLMPTFDPKTTNWTTFMQDFKDLVLEMGWHGQEISKLKLCFSRTMKAF